MPATRRAQNLFAFFDLGTLSIHRLPRSPAPTATEASKDLQGLQLGFLMTFDTLLPPAGTPDMTRRKERDARSARNERKEVARD